ncbi:MAG: hypothetical protein QMC90_00975 [Dehalococcoidales bacterium]|nr:hypothetical protein [Dehalococcoidales bacterium]
MKWMKRIFIAIGILILVGVASFVLYGIAYSEGETAGYEAGYSVGKQHGYDEGYISGKQEGYDEGYSSGRADGYNEGYEVGIKAGLGHGYTLRDPTYKEVITFLKEDKTDKNKYVEDTYVCSHFARDVGNNAEAKGLRCAFIVLRYPDGGHAIIAFNTIDEGLVYFEPQSDERVRPVIGKRFYQCIEPRPGYYYKEPEFDDTIVDILVIW